MNTKSTESEEYSIYLSNQPLWKRLLDVQAPYRWNLKRLGLTNVLDVGCGTGRNLTNLAQLGIAATGVDHNRHSVERATAAGFKAYTSGDFLQEQPDSKQTFDSLLISHVLEHMPFEQAVALLNSYLPYLNAGAIIVVITPQEAGYNADATHVNFVDFTVSESILKACNCEFDRSYSFPFPRSLGKVFKYNEFVVVGRYIG